MTAYDYRQDFPLLRENKTVYIDNAATAQRPDCVLEAEKRFYETANANPLRGFYPLSLAATEQYEEARKTVQKFIHAKSSKEIIFTRNTTESLNLVAYSYGLSNLREGDEIVVSIMEHHSNLLPWQMVARQTGAVLKFLECTQEGTLPDEVLEAAITEKTKLVAVAQVSNVLGCVNPVEKIVKLAHEKGAVVVVDAAQSAPHMPVDVTALDVDFLAFSGHKLMGPMGIGVLYGKEELLGYKREMRNINAAGILNPLQEKVRYMLRFLTSLKREQSMRQGLPDLRRQSAMLKKSDLIPLWQRKKRLLSVQWRD